MITPSEAETVIRSLVPPLPAEDCSLAAALGRVLRAPIVADRDLPPFDRVTMDGFAMQAAPRTTGPRRLRSLGFQAAGMMPLTIDDDVTCVEIATGAVLPSGADCIVPYEETSRLADVIVVKEPGDFPSGTYIHRRGSDNAEGSTLVAAGAILSGREIAVGAACGATTLRVSIQPRIAVIATGDELAEVETKAIAPHHIRRSNDYALRAALLSAGYTRIERFHFRDVREEILNSLKGLLNEFDVLILTGGISKGKFDFLPEVFTELKVSKKIQGITQRPGKPFWFGISSRNTPIFALPGNPVSTYTCFTRYVLPALRQMSGATAEPATFAALTEKVIFRPKLSFMLPVRLESSSNGQQLARPAATNTSGDFAGLIGTHGFVELPSNAEDFPVGFVARFYPWA